MINLKGESPIKTKWEQTKTKEAVKDGYTELSRTGFYNKKKWKDLREYVFAREPLCRTCLKQNKVKVAFAIDHIESITEDSSEELKYGLDNLQPLCYFHHRKKTSDDYIEKQRARKREKGKLLQDSFDDW